MPLPGWFDGLPEYVTEAEYRDLSEDISHTIEIVHGHVIKCEPPTPRAQQDRPAPGERPHTSVLELEHPIRLTLPISDLVSG